MADYFDYYLSTYDDPKEELDQRYLVDIISEPYQVAVRNNLSFVEGVIYNGISFIIERKGFYSNLPEDENWLYFHINRDEYEASVNSLLKKGLIVENNNQLSINRLTYDQLKEDQTMIDLGLSGLMEALKNKMMGVSNE